MAFGCISSSVFLSFSYYFVQWMHHSRPGRTVTEGILIGKEREYGFSSQCWGWSFALLSAKHNLKAAKVRAERDRWRHPVENHEETESTGRCRGCCCGGGLWRVAAARWAASLSPLLFLILFDGINVKWVSCHKFYFNWENSLFPCGCTLQLPCECSL